MNNTQERRPENICAGYITTAALAATIAEDVFDDFEELATSDQLHADELARERAAIEMVKEARDADTVARAQWEADIRASTGLPLLHLSRLDDINRMYEEVFHHTADKLSKRSTAESACETVASKLKNELLRDCEYSNSAVELCRDILADAKAIGDESFVSTILEKCAAKLRHYFMSDFKALKEQNAALQSQLRALKKQAAPVKEKKRKIETVAPADIPADMPQFPESFDKDALEVWAHEYCRALCEKFSSQRLMYKLFGRPENPGGGSLNWQIASIPDDEAARPAWLNSAKLSFDKKVVA